MAKLPKVRRKPGATSAKIARVGKKAAPVVDASAAAAARTGAALLAAGVSPLGAALMAGGGGLAGALVAGAFRFFVAHAASRWKLWFEEYARGDARDPALVEAQLQAEADNPIVQQLVVESARGIADALSDSVVPVLARLTRQYRSAGQGPDDFFRSMRRLLSEVNDLECAVLRGVIDRAAAVHVPNAEQRWVGFERQMQAVRMKRLAGRPGSAEHQDLFGTVMNQEGGDLPWNLVLARVLQLLNDAFGVDMQMEFGVSQSLPLVLEIEVARRVSVLMK